MPEYLSPGVYVEEVSSGVKPIEGVGTSTGAFIGFAESGPVKTPVLCTSWTQFKETFGEFTAGGYLAYSVYQFFNEGGTKCFVVRAIAAGSAKASAVIKASTGINSLAVTSDSEGVWGNKVTIRIEAEVPVIPGTLVRDDHFKLTVLNDGAIVELFNGLTMTEIEPGHISKKVVSDWVILTDMGNLRPVNGDSLLTGGSDGTTEGSGKAALIGAIGAFDTVDAINIMAIPDAMGDPVVTQAGYTYCLNRKDVFFVADTPMGLIPSSPTIGVDNFRMNIGKFNSSFGALYYPWIKVFDPLTGGTKLTPPSGAIVGTYSHTDVARGVHKAPAGIDEGYLNSVSDVEYPVSKGEHDLLNPMGVNVIRSFPGLGNVVWGARTLSADSEWKYVNVRRLFLFLEESIDEGTQWVVFEPNTPILWGKVKRNLTAFLTRVWRDGALFGTTAEEAFFVKVDAENNPPSVVDAGQLIIEVGVAPVKPAEFVIIRISQKVLAGS
jgi:hypothetical protein